MLQSRHVVEQVGPTLQCKVVRLQPSLQPPSLLALMTAPDVGGWGDEQTDSRAERVISNDWTLASCSRDQHHVALCCIMLCGLLIFTVQSRVSIMLYDARVMSFESAPLVLYYCAVLNQTLNQYYHKHFARPEQSRAEQRREAPDHTSSYHPVPSHGILSYPVLLHSVL